MQIVRFGTTHTDIDVFQFVLLQIEYDLMTLSDMCVLLALTRVDTFMKIKPLNRHVDR